MDYSCGTFNQLQTGYQLIRLIEVDGFHVVANRIHLSNIVFGNLNRIVDKCPEYRHFLYQIGPKIRANGLNSKLSADALNSILFTALKKLQFK